MGAVVGSGVFVLTGVAAARYAGPGVILSLLIAALTASLTALAYAELAALVPVAGSAYTYTYVALGELAAWVVGWDLLHEYAMVGGAVAIGWSSYAAELLAAAGLELPHHLAAPPAAGGLINLPALLVVIALTALLLAGLRESLGANRALVAVKLVALFLFLALGLPRIDPAHWRPLLPLGLGGVTRGAALVFFAFIGFDAVSTATRQARNPGRDLPRGIVGSLLAATLLYLAVAAVLTGLVPSASLDTPSPLTVALSRAGAAWAAPVVGLGAVAGLTSVLLVSLFGLSRILHAMSADGLLPPFFSRARQPVILLAGLATGLAAALLDLGKTVELANIGTLIAFALVNLGVIALRRARPDLRRPFRMPLVPYLPVLAGVTALYLMSRLPSLTWWRFGVWLLSGLVVYFLYGRRHSRVP